MSRTIVRVLFFTLPAVAALQCTHTEQKAEGLQGGRQSDVSDYWHQGKAEVSRFDLEQVRYGESHRGHAVLIFVKEQFLPESQVKFDGLESQESPVDIMKHIATRDFYTGIYPYSMMTTVFSPFASSQHGAYKITGTTLDWCGQTYMQLNRRDGRFAVQYHSYFQEEGDRDFTINGALLEDDLWSMVRTNPDKLPVGEISIFPSSHCVQLRIREFYPHDATGRLEKSLDPSISADSISVYTVRYSDIPRTFAIMFEPSFPYAILAWEETEDNVAERNGTPPLRTRGVRTHSLMLDYWNRSSKGDSTYRSILGLD